MIISINAEKLVDKLQHSIILHYLIYCRGCLFSGFCQTLATLKASKWSMVLPLDLQESASYNVFLLLFALVIVDIVVITLLKQAACVIFTYAYFIFTSPHRVSIIIIISPPAPQIQSLLEPISL